MAQMPSKDDQIVRVRAYLTDEVFGYDHWRAAQWSAEKSARTTIASGEDSPMPGLPSYGHGASP